MSTDERNPTTYRERLNSAVFAAGKGDAGWNNRFLSALNDRDLTLADTFDTVLGLYPDDLPFYAPRHYGQKAEWSENARVIWRA